MDAFSHKILIGMMKISIVACAFAGGILWAGQPGDLTPRVPPEHLEEAKSLQNPLPSSPDIVAKGKKLYEGRSYCAAWQASRTDGELFWILKHGSHGTDMAPFMPLFLTEEEAWQIITYLRTFGET